MRRFSAIALIIGLCAGASTASAWAQSNPFVGRWHWDRAQSAVPPGEPIPEDITLEILRADPTHVTGRSPCSPRQGARRRSRPTTPRPAASSVRSTATRWQRLA